MTSFSGAARRLFLLTALVSASSPSSSSSLVAAESEPTGPEWRSDLNWTNLASELSPSASLIDTSYENFRDECWSEFSFLGNLGNYSVNPNPSTHGLIDQPSGMCVPHFFLGWEMGWPRPSVDGHLNGTIDQYLQDMFDPSSYDEIIPGYFNDETNPSLNLPPKVLFPSVASDVIKTIKFAKKNAVEISVKNSGHSYSGSSSKKNTLLLNMNRYKHYAPDGITDCDATLLGTVVAKDLSNQACLLALARNKSSMIRIGGGENYDKVYRAVIAANKALEEYRYHLVGGAAGTVSPMGWTWQGGNAGTTGGRLYGKGVDQVLQVEMVLPNGYHVKFGPTEWEDASAEGFAIPRTKVVSGVCRSNPNEEDEENWIWGDCPGDFDIDFGDLWFAVNGGGGGSWGVVTSVHLQLHDILPFNHFRFRDFAEECSAIAPTFELFQATYFMAPALLDVSKEKSIACSSSDRSGSLMCFGEEDVMEAWARFLELNNSTDPSASACVVKSPDYYQELYGLSYEPPKSFPDEMLLLSPLFLTPGKIADGGAPGPFPNFFAHVLVPQSWLDESEENINILLKNKEQPPYYAYGEATASFSDQANSLSQAHRDAAVMVNLFGLDNEADFWSNLFPKMFDISDKTKFPPVFGSNHAGILLSGPLKEDWTKLCPREWTFEERRKKCISPQEAIYGTELLSRLEAIKMAVDPQFMFNCTNCIGNNLDLAKAPKVPIDQLSGASFVSTYATAVSAAMLHLFLSILY